MGVEEDELYFYGDMMEKGQNDYALGQAVQKRGGHSHCVKDWKDTMMKLNKV